MIGIDRAKLRAMSAEALAAECRKLSDEWLAKGSPDLEHMPRIMLAKYVALVAERQRRGFQMTLWEVPF